MNRRLSIAVALAAAGSLGVSLTSCNAPSCGPGTVQQQQKDGTLKCVPVDMQEGGIQCDVDGGNATIVGGKCVSAIQCDPATTVEVNGICVGKSGGGFTCSKPSAGNACISGKIIDFKTNMPGSTALDVTLWDPLQLLGGGMPVETCMTDGATYVCPDYNPTKLSLGIGIVVTGAATPNFVGAGSAGQGLGASTYNIDTYEVLKADADKWNFDYATNGAFIAKFYSDAKPTLPNITVATDTHPVSGVTLLKNGGDAMANYFDDTLTAITTGATMTGASGTAIVASPLGMGGSFPSFTGNGGMNQMGMPITWETLQGGSQAGLILIIRFHPN